MNNRGIIMGLGSVCLGLLALPANLWAESVTLRPVADTTLFENDPDNNLGASTSTAAGTTTQGKKSRALLRFDFAADVPAGAVVTNASLRVRASKSPGFGAANSTFDLRRVLASWAEGAKAGNRGAPAAAGETTWNSRMAPSTAWGAPGGLAGTDFSTTNSASVLVGNTGPYTFGSTPELIADVQAWLDHPDTNFGWLLLSEAEQTTGTARRFDSREAGANAPELTLEFSMGATELQITSIIAAPPNALITWTGGQPPFQLESKASITETNWAKVGEVISTNTTAVEISGDQRFFRVSESR